MEFPGGLDGKASAHNVGDMGSVPGLGRSPGEGNGNPLQYSGLENSMDGGAWWATVHGVHSILSTHSFVCISKNKGLFFKNIKISVTHNYFSFFMLIYIRIQIKSTYSNCLYAS